MGCAVAGAPAPEAPGLGPGSVAPLLVTADSSVVVPSSLSLPSAEPIQLVPATATAATAIIPLNGLRLDIVIPPVFGPSTVPEITSVFSSTRACSGYKSKKEDRAGKLLPVES